VAYVVDADRNPVALATDVRRAIAGLDPWLLCPPSARWTRCGRTEPADIALAAAARVWHPYSDSSEARMDGTAPNANAWTRWVPSRPPAEKDRPRLFCFPHAGGGSAAFHSWATALAEVEIFAVEYPGRWTRIGEPPLTKVHQLANAIADGLGEVMTGRYAFFGHSYGALIAFETARALRRRRGSLPQHLFVSAAQAPQLPRPSAISALPNGELVAALAERYGELPKVIRESPELLELVVPIIRADLTALETYTFDHEAALSCPITSIRGRADTSIDEDAVKAWHCHTAGRFSAHVLAGGHFFQSADLAEVLSIVRNALAPPTHEA
jgi:medium-chain acyl-[acyl-carrier-protein] hydrolase